MTRFGLTAVVLSVGALLLSSTANAGTITLFGSTGGTPQELTSGPSPHSFLGTCCTGGTSTWEVLANAVGTTTDSPHTFLSDSIDAHFASGSGTLFLWFTESGLTSPFLPGTVHIATGLTSNSLIGDVSNARLSAYFSNANAIAPPVTEANALLIHDFTSEGTVTGTKTGLTLVSPYSLQAAYRITSSGPGSANVTINITTSGAPIPEPGTLALLGTGVVGLGGLLRRKLNL